LRRPVRHTGHTRLCGSRHAVRPPLRDNSGCTGQHAEFIALKWAKDL